MINEETNNLHNLYIKKREKLEITGVTDVISFDEDNVICETTLGILYIKGKNFKVNRLNIEKGELFLDGEIISLNYEDEFNKKSTSLISKIFK